MGVEKMSVSFDLELGVAIRASATAAGRSVSAWLGEAARDRLRLDALGEAVTAWEQEYGPLTEEDVAGADLLLEGVADERRPGAA